MAAFSSLIACTASHTAASRGSTSASPSPVPTAVRVLATPVTALPSGPAPSNSIPLGATVDRSCGRPGDTMVARAHTDRGASLEFVAAYTGSSHPDFVQVPASVNSTGGYVWRWRIGTGVAYGRGVLAVSAKRGSSKATYVVWFDVKKTC